MTHKFLTCYSKKFTKQGPSMVQHRKEVEIYSPCITPVTCPKGRRVMVVSVKSVSRNILLPILQLIRVLEFFIISNRHKIRCPDQPNNGTLRYEVGSPGLQPPPLDKFLTDRFPCTCIVSNVLPLLDR